MSRGKVITIEGIDGGGKSTQLDAVAGALRARDVSLVVTREPGGTPLGERLRKVLLAQPMGAEAEVLLMFAARAEHLRSVIRPALEAGQWVLCDRFTDASYAYQGGGRGLAAERISALEAWVHADLQPDLTLLFDLAPEVAATRLAQARGADRFEGEPLRFHAAVRDAYLRRARAAPTRIVVVDAARDAEVIRGELAELIAKWTP